MAYNYKWSKQISIHLGIYAENFLKQYLKYLRNTKMYSYVQKALCIKLKQP